MTPAGRFSSLGVHEVHKVPVARVVKPSHQLVEESEQRVAQALGRELRVPVLAAETAFVRVIGLPVDRNARELRERRRSVGICRAEMWGSCKRFLLVCAQFMTERYF